MWSLPKTKLKIDQHVVSETGRGTFFFSFNFFQRLKERWTLCAFNGFQIEIQKYLYMRHFHHTDVLECNCILYLSSCPADSCAINDLDCWRFIWFEALWWNICNKGNWTLSEFRYLSWWVKQHYQHIVKEKNY